MKLIEDNYKDCSERYVYYIFIFKCTNSKFWKQTIKKKLLRLWLLQAFIDFYTVQKIS